MRLILWDLYYKTYTMRLILWDLYYETYTMTLILRLILWDLYYNINLYYNIDLYYKTIRLIYETYIMRLIPAIRSTYTIRFIL